METLGTPLFTDKCITVSLHQDFLNSPEFKMTGILPSPGSFLNQTTGSSQILPSLFCNYNFITTSKNDNTTNTIFIQAGDDASKENINQQAINHSNYNVESSKESGIGATLQVQFKSAYNGHYGNANDYQAVQSALAIKNEIESINNSLNADAESSLQEHLDEAYQNYECDFDTFRSVFNIEGATPEEQKLFKLESEEGFPLQVITQDMDANECDAQSLQTMIKKEMYFESGLDSLEAHLAGLVSGGKLEYPQQEVKSNKRYECQYCHRVFSKPTCLRVHQRIHIDERPYKCEECGLSFSTEANLKVHEKVHNGSGQFNCKVCGKCFGELQNLRNHQKLHITETPYKCDMCDEYFNTSAKLKIHRMIHTMEKPLEYCLLCSNIKRCGEPCESCENCNVIVTDPSIPPAPVVVVPSNLNLSAIPQPSVSPNIATASISPSVITPSVSPDSITPNIGAVTMTHIISPTTTVVNPSHVIKQTNHITKASSIKKPFKCNECDKCFNNLDDLEFHELRHKDSKPFKCEFCGRGFSRKFNMQRHEKIHAGGVQL